MVFFFVEDTGLVLDARQVFKLYDALDPLVEIEGARVVFRQLAGCKH